MEEQKTFEDREPREPTAWIAKSFSAVMPKGVEHTSAASQITALKSQARFELIAVSRGVAPATKQRILDTEPIELNELLDDVQDSGVQRV